MSSARRIYFLDTEKFIHDAQRRMRTFRRLIGWPREKAQPPSSDAKPPALSLSDSKLDLSEDIFTPVSFSNSARLLDEPIAASSTTTAIESSASEEDSTPLWSTLPDGVVAAASPLLDGYMSKLGNFTSIGYIKNYPHIVVAKDNERGMYVVIKSQQARSPRRDEAEFKSIHEAGIMKMLSDHRLDALRGHKNIISFIDHIPCFKTNLHLSIIEYCEGGSLYRFVRRHGGRVSVSQKLGLIRDCTNGIDYLHSMNIAHRDIKLDNMFLKYDDMEQRYVVKIGDFGFATMTLEDAVFSHKRGSAAYAAPELLRHGQYNPFPVDVWAFGVVLYAMFEGVFPFETQNREGLLVDNAVGLIINKLGEFVFSDKNVDTRLGPLINTIFQFNPDLRPTMTMIASSTFLPTRNDGITRDMLATFEAERAARLMREKKE